jgi:FKBP-type peptidyl-prolyl cis-trans isomerase
MRRLLTAVVACLATVAAAACGGDPASTPGLPTVTGAAGADPAISVPAGKPPAGLVVRTLVRGSGPVVASTDFVMLDVEGKVWAGSRLVIDSFLRHQPQGLPLRSALPAWRRLAGHRVGSRILMVVPPGFGFGPRGNPAINVTGSDTLVFVFAIIAAIPAGAHATGTPVPYRPGPSLPRVSQGPGAPTITVAPHVPPPAHLVTRVLMAGHGPVVSQGESIVVQYTGVIWRTRKIFNSSWLQGSPQAFGLGSGQLIPGWDKGLTGQRTGSRLLLVIPPALGYGKNGNPPLVKGTDTLVYVVDILAAFKG